MRVPFLENALIEEQKIVGYLLSESLSDSHPEYGQSGVLRMALLFRG